MKLTGGVMENDMDQPERISTDNEPSSAAPCSASLPPVLDACCSIRAFWFDKRDDRALFVDKRSETITRKDTSNGNGTRELVIAPDVQADFTNLPFPDESFWHVVYDPPHKKREQANGGFLVQHYGMLNGDWRKMLQDGFAECFRVLKPGGTLIFKWAETEFPLREILALTPHKPLYGHRSGKAAKTYWCAFLKPNAWVTYERSELGAPGSYTAFSQTYPQRRDF